MGTDAQVDTDGSGIVRVVSGGVVEYDRTTGNTAVNRSGWSTRVKVVSSRYKNVNESSGAAVVRHNSTES
jgi:hypothetical protein